MARGLTGIVASEDAIVEKPALALLQELGWQHVDLHGDRSLTLRHVQSDRRPLDEGFEEVLKHVARLWGFTVRLETVFEDGRSEMTHETKVEKRRRYALSA